RPVNGPVLLNCVCTGEIRGVVTLFRTSCHGTWRLGGRIRGCPDKALGASSLGHPTRVVAHSICGRSGHRPFHVYDPPGDHLRPALTQPCSHGSATIALSSLINAVTTSATAATKSVIETMPRWNGLIFRTSGGYFEQEAV